MKKWFVLLIGSNEKDDEELLPPNVNLEEVRKRNPHASRSFNFQHMFINFINRDYDEMLVFTKGFFDHDNEISFLFFHLIVHDFYSSLVSFWIYRKTSDPLWLERGRQAKLAMKKWAEAASEHNFLHKVYLMEAEEAFSSDYTELAKSMYEKAVATAKKHRFINDEALACELAGYFFLETQEKELALQYFLQANEKYHEWGAVAKSDALHTFIQSNFDSHSQLAAPPNQSNTGISDTTPRKRGIGDDSGE